MDSPSNSVRNLWECFVRKYPINRNVPIPNHFHFCDNEDDANKCATLVVQKIKQATASSVWWYEYQNEPMPKVGTLFIVTDWHAMAKAIIEITKLEQVRFKDVGEAFAHTEGEGDKSLAYWRKAHKNYYTRQMKPFGAVFREDMMICCTYFRTVFVSDS